MREGWLQSGSTSLYKVRSVCLCLCVFLGFNLLMVCVALYLHLQFSANTTTFLKYMSLKCPCLPSLPCSPYFTLSLYEMCENYLWLTLRQHWSRVFHLRTALIVVFLTLHWHESGTLLHGWKSAAIYLASSTERLPAPGQETVMRYSC